MSVAESLDRPPVTPGSHPQDLSTTPSNGQVWFAVLVAALGYFVDVFDIWLFSNLRVPSLSSMGLSADQVTTIGGSIINYQQAGLLLGGFAWGILGDKRGRAGVMFGSIALYSTANLLNGFVTNVEQYKILRFIAGVGLAGEIGTGITLMTELLPVSKRGIATTLVTALGVSGACFAAFAAKALEWRHAYVLGGVMGLALLGLRFAVAESKMFHAMTTTTDAKKRGSLRLLFGSVERCARFASCVAVGVPIYLTFGLFTTFAPEISRAIGVQGEISVPDTLFVGSLAMTLGDLLAGASSQFVKSRRLPIALMVTASAVANVALALGLAKTVNGYLTLIAIGGLCSGYWACILTVGAEQFGTNLRATVTTALPNLIRASLIPLTSAFVALKGTLPVTTSLLVICACVYPLAFAGLWYLKETFHRNLNFYEV